MNVKIRKLSEHARIPTYGTVGAAAFDLYAAEDVIIAPGETVKVPLGFAVEIPDGFEMQIRPRSGVSLNTKLRVANAPGTIDSDYRGEAAVIVDNIAKGREKYGISSYYTVRGINGLTYQADGERYEDGTYIIRRGDRIAQAVIVPVPKVTFEVVDEELTQTERGAGGFGSTGTGTEVSAE